jgi:hypothetical protein
MKAGSSHAQPNALVPLACGFRTLERLCGLKKWRRLDRVAAGWLCRQDDQERTNLTELYKGHGGCRLVVRLTPDWLNERLTVPRSYDRPRDGPTWTQFTLALNVTTRHPLQLVEGSCSYPTRGPQ